jgi:hypothetical protein
MCTITLEDIGGESCEPIAGLVSTIDIAPIADFTLIADIPDLDAVGDLASKATITGPHTFPVGKGFSQIAGVEETGSIKSTMIGETGRHLFQNELVVEVAGSEAKLLGWLRVVKNLKFIAAVTEFGNGQVRQMGSSRFPARFTGIEAAIEALAEGKNSVTLTITDKQVCPAPVYTGIITMKPVV